MNKSIRVHALRNAALASVFGFVAQAGAATLIPVPPVPGSLGTAVFGINDTNVIAGSYLTPDYVTHGFVGPLDGSGYATFDYPGSGVVYTEARGLNNAGYVTGWAAADDGDTLYQFVRDPDGSIATITKDGAPLHGFVAQGINSANQFVGDYAADDGSGRRAYLGQGSAWKADLNVPFNPDDAVGRGVNNLGATVGYFRDSAGRAHGFLLLNGVATQIDYPAPDQTVMEAINDKGIAVGQVIGTRFFGKSFLLDTNTNTFQPIQWPRQTQAFGLNNSGLVAINIEDGSNPGPYIYCPTSLKHCPVSPGQIKIPDATPVKLPADQVKSYVVTAAGMKTSSSGKRRGDIPNALSRPAGTDRTLVSRMRAEKDASRGDLAEF